MPVEQRYGDRSGAAGADVKEVTNTASFIDDLGADSLDIVELVMRWRRSSDRDPRRGGREDQDGQRRDPVHHDAQEIASLPGSPIAGARAKNDMRRVVVTDWGGDPRRRRCRSTWDAILAGTSGVGPITRFDAKDFSTTIAAEVKGFDPSGSSTGKRSSGWTRSSTTPWRLRTCDGGRGAGDRRGAGAEGGRLHGKRAGRALTSSGTPGVHGGGRGRSALLHHDAHLEPRPGHIAMRYGAKGRTSPRRRRARRPATRPARRCTRSAAGCATW